MARKDIRIAGARTLFKKALAKEIPAVLQGLKQQVYPYYAALTPEVAQKSYSHLGLKTLEELKRETGDPDDADHIIDPEVQLSGLPISWRAVRLGASRTPEARALYEALVGWADRFNFSGTNWMLDSAVETLSIWRANPKSADQSLNWGRLPRIRAYTIQPIEVSCPEWDPELESWDAWHEGTRLYLRGQRESMMAAAREHGYLEEPVKKVEAEHFRWLALYQCGGEQNKGLSPKEICRYLKVETTDNNVFKAVQDKAELIHLKLRAPKRESERQKDERES